MPRRTFILILCLFALIVIIFTITSSKTTKIQVNKNQPSYKPTPTSIAQTTISLSPQVIDLTQNLTADVFVTMDSGGNAIVAVQMVIAYDPTLLRVEDVRPFGSMKQSNELLKDINTKNGRISYALGLVPTQKPIISRGEPIAIVTFSRLQPVSATGGIQTSVLTLQKRSLASALGIGPSVIKDLFGATVLLPATPSASLPN